MHIDVGKLGTTFIFNCVACHQVQMQKSELKELTCSARHLGNSVQMPEVG